MPPVYRTLPAAATASVILLAATWPAGLARAHSHASIDARFEVRGAQVDASMRLSLRDLRHMVLVDRDRDGRLSPEEVEAAQEPLAAYFERTLRLGLIPGDVACEQSMAGLRIVDFSSVDVHLRFRCPRRPAALALSAGLFAGTGHTYQLLARFLFAEEERRVELTSRRNRAEVELTATGTDGGGGGWLTVAGVISLVAAALALVVVVVGAGRRRRQRD